MVLLLLYVVLWPLLLCGSFIIISGAFVIICGTLVIICGTFYIICGTLFLIIICGAFVIICGAFFIMRMKSRFDGDLGKSFWKSHNAMGADVDDPPFCFQRPNYAPYSTWIQF